MLEYRERQKNFKASHNLLPYGRKNTHNNPAYVEISQNTVNSQQCRISNT